MEFNRRLFYILILFLGAFLGLSEQVIANPKSCSEVLNPEVKSASFTHTFTQGHNTSLRAVMVNMKKQEGSIREFVTGLKQVSISKYIKDDSAKFRNFEKLEEVLETAYRYRKILQHLVEHAETHMMTPRIEMVAVEKKDTFTKNYQQSYRNYLSAIENLILELETYREIDPKNWNPQLASDILMNMHSQMGAAHDRF